MELDHVAVLHRAQALVIRSSGENVSGFQCSDTARPLYAAGNVVGHVAGREVLTQIAVHPQPNVEVHRIGYLVSRHYARPHRSERVPGLALKEVVAAESARRAVDEVHITEDMLICVFSIDVRRLAADHESKLGLVVEYGCGSVGKDERVAVANDRVRRLEEGVD